MARKKIPDNFYNKIKPCLYERIGKELSVAYRILAVGCGTCELVRFLKNRYRQQVTGVDVSSEKFPKRQSQSGAKGYVRCVHADASRLTFLQSASIDAAVAMWALHEIVKPDAVLREVRRKLRPRGRVLIVDFPRRSLAKRLWDENYYTLFQVRSMLKKAGFQEVRAQMIERHQVIWATALRS